MRITTIGAAALRHGITGLLEAALLGAIVLALIFAVAPVLGLKPASAPAVDAGRAAGVVTVVTPVAHGETTTVTVNPGGADVYVFVQCYAPTFGGEYVYAAYFPIDADKQAVVGPLASSLWTSGSAECTAKEGYFRRDGFGRWVTVAQASFNVTG